MEAVAIEASSPAIQRVVYAGTGNTYGGGKASNKGIASIAPEIRQLHAFH
jgi:hypothetical protein